MSQIHVCTHNYKNFLVFIYLCAFLYINYVLKAEKIVYVIIGMVLHPVPAHQASMASPHIVVQSVK